MATAKHTKSDKILNWITGHGLVSILGIEKAAKIPQGTLNRSLRDGNIPDKHIAILEAILKPYGYK